MELKKAKCPGCGGILELDTSLEKGACLYCGSEIIVKEAVRQFTGEIDGIATTKNMLLRAKQMLSTNDADGAIKAYKKILETAPTHYEAWWGLFMCEISVAKYYREIHGGTRSAIIRYIDSLKLALSNYASYAVEYAPNSEKTGYEKIIKDIEQEISSTEIPELPKGGCYIATAIYGSYDVPEVLVLRRFRDEILANSVSGRLFIRMYYFISPKVAEKLKNTKFFNSIVRMLLDNIVSVLSKKVFK